MTRGWLAGLLVVTMVGIGCAGRTDPAVSSAAQPALAGATITFTSLEDGKDAKSTATVELVRNGNQLAAEAMTTGTEFDDNSTAPPIAMTLRGPFTRDDANSGQLRLRLTPDGDDTWTFTVGLALRFADETQRNYRWTSVRLDEKAPERTLVLAGAETP
jgi:hypothetical protein